MNAYREASLLDWEMSRGERFRCGESFRCGTRIWMWNGAFRDFDSLSDVFDGLFPSTDCDSNRASQLTSLVDLLSLIFLLLENPVIHDLYCVLEYPPA